MKSKTISVLLTLVLVGVGTGGCGDRQDSSTARSVAVTRSPPAADKDKVVVKDKAKGGDKV